MDLWQNPQILAIYLAIALLFVAVLVSAIIISVKLSIDKAIKAQERASQLQLQHQQKLLETSIRIQERERTRIAADVHDELIGKLTAIKTMNHLQYDQTQMNLLLEKSIDIARRISHDLMPPLLEFASIESLVKELINPWQLEFEIQEIFQIDNSVEANSNIKIHLTRIIQEIFINIIKHSSATLVKVHFRLSKCSISLIIQDNGKGFDVKKVKNGLGLSNIEMRIQYLKGKYKLKSEINMGSKYILHIPLASTELI